MNNVNAKQITTYRGKKSRNVDYTDREEYVCEGNAQRMATNKRVARGHVCLERGVAFQPQHTVCGVWLKTLEGAKQQMEKGCNRGRCPAHWSSLRGQVEKFCTWISGTALPCLHDRAHGTRTCEWRGYGWSEFHHLEHENVMAEVSGQVGTLNTILSFPPKCNLFLQAIPNEKSVGNVVLVGHVPFRCCSRSSR